MYNILFLETEIRKTSVVDVVSMSENLSKKVAKILTQRNKLYILVTHQADRRSLLDTKSFFPMTQCSTVSETLSHGKEVIIVSTWKYLYMTHTPGCDAELLAVQYHLCGAWK